MMPFLFRRMAQVLLVATMPLVPAFVYAQQPVPPDPVPPAQGPPPAPEDPPPADDGPKPAGVGSSQPPKPEEDPDAPVDPIKPLPATSFPGVPLSGTAPSARPFSGLFGGAEPAYRRKHSLTLSGSLFAAYSTNVAPQSLEGQSDPQIGHASPLAGGSGSVNYSRNWDSGAVGAHLDASRSWIEAYQDTRNPWVSRWNVGVDGGISRDLTRRTRVGARGSVGYSPYVTFGVNEFSAGSIATLPGDIPGLDYALARDPSVLTTASATVSYALNRKSSLEASYELRDRRFVASSPQQFDRLEQFAGGRYRYRFSRYAGLRVGYGHRRTSFGGPDAEPIANHTIDLGLDAGYGRSYALSRQTTFSFSTDSSLFVDETVDNRTTGDDSFDPRTRVFFGGSADLTHTMGRSWAARTGYRRGVSYEAGFDRPLLSDTALGALSGLITERLDFNAAAHYTSGRVGFSGADNGYDTSSATARLRYAITRELATYAQYFYYHTAFQRNVVLPYYLQPNLNRQGVSVGITAWLPLIGPRGRR
jgi:hypothetical protein